MVKAETGSEASVKGRQAVWSWARWSKMSRQDGSDGGTTQGRIVGVPSHLIPQLFPRTANSLQKLQFVFPFQHSTADKQSKEDLNSAQVHAPQANFEAIPYVFVRLGYVCGGYG